MARLGCAMILLGFAVSRANAFASNVPLRLAALEALHSHMRKPMQRLASTLPRFRGGGVPEGTSVRNSPGSSATTAAPKDLDDKMKILVMYVIVRRDLNWPLGSVVAQGAHAATAVLWETRDEPNVATYCGDLDRMHKIVLGADNAKQLLKVARDLSDQGFKHKVWIEQPEGTPTAIATMPYPRGDIAPILKKLPLLKQ